LLNLSSKFTIITSLIMSKPARSCLVPKACTIHGAITPCMACVFWIGWWRSIHWTVRIRIIPLVSRPTCLRLCWCSSFSHEILQQKSHIRTGAIQWNAHALLFMQINSWDLQLPYLAKLLNQMLEVHLIKKTEQFLYINENTNNISNFHLVKDYSGQSLHQKNNSVRIAFNHMN